jgi:RNA polymerase sigma factor (TIGR02999 family)
VPAGAFTAILDRVRRGEEQAADRLLPLVYDELRRLAAARMAHETPGMTLQPTALVHEAWIRLGADHQPDWKSRAQFFAAAAEAMRRILIDAARRRLAQRRGGQQEHVPLEGLEIAIGTEDSRIVAVSDALERFGLEEPDKAKLVKLRFFVGFELQEAAQALGISQATAGRWWNFARAWLIEEVGEWKEPARKS